MSDSDLQRFQVKAMLGLLRELNLNQVVAGLDLELAQAGAPTPGLTLLRDVTLALRAAQRAVEQAERSYLEKHASTGWLGELGAVLQFLADEGAEREPDGSFRVSGPPDQAPLTYMGQAGPKAELLIPPLVSYYKKGREILLVPALTMSGLGLSGMGVI